MSLAVDSEPSNIPMNVQIRRPDAISAIDIDFNDELFTTFTPAMGSGEYMITISNLGTRNLQV